MSREMIEQAPSTRNLKTRLYEIRNEVLDYLVFNEPDDKITDLLREAELKISDWREINIEHLINDEGYYQQIAHRIMEPVHVTMESRTDHGNYHQFLQ